jgi:SAM-dependent methyltransferase
MAKIEYLHPATEHSLAFCETIEVRVWSMGGSEDQPFYIGSGLNFVATANLWLEISYSIEGAQIFYTRNFLHNDTRGSTEDAAELAARLEETARQGEGSFGFGEDLPETSIQLKFHKYTYTDNAEVEQTSRHSSLVISADTGAVFGRTSPGMRAVEIKLDLNTQEQGMTFMRELIHEVAAVQQGQHPDPASFGDGSSEWPFVWQLNSQAYDRAAADYQENYFANPRLEEAFTAWLAQLPPGGQVLDAGCGHGSPVIASLLAAGLQVTGSDFSPEMLRRAAEQFPGVPLLPIATTQLRAEGVYAGICSFNSLLYFDPIDLLNSIRRLHAALKPGGLLFLYGYDSGPDWRGEPFRFSVKQWLWAWHYGMDEAAHLLAEHGYFSVELARKVTVDPEDEQRVAAELEKQRLAEEEYYRKQQSTPNDLPIQMPFFKRPVEHSPYSFVLIARRCER